MSAEVKQQDNIETNLNQQNAEPKIEQEQVKKQDEPIKAEEQQQEDPNWRAFREARKRDRAEREAAERRAAEKEAEAAALKAAMEAAFAKQAVPQQSYFNQQEEFEETEEQRIEKKVNQILQKREEQQRRESQEREMREYPNRLQSNYLDFSQVISQENLDYLDYHFPEVSRPLQRLPDGYDKWSDIYHAVKKFVPNHTTAKKEAAKAEANLAKPKSISAMPSITPPGSARESWVDAQKRREARYQEMKKIINGVGQ